MSILGKLTVIISLLIVLALLPLLGFMLIFEYWHNFYIVSTIMLLLLVFMIISRRLSITDANLYFLVFFVTYQIVIPYLYLHNIAWVVGGEFFIFNWRLASVGNVFSICGILTYMFCMEIARVTVPKQSISKQNNLMLTTKTAQSLTPVYLAIAIISWFVLYLFSNMPAEVFFGITPHSRYRGLFYELFGHGYIIALTFGGVLSLLMFTISFKHKSVFSFKFILFYYSILVLNAFDGSRLIVFMAPVSAYMLNFLNRKQNAIKDLEWDEAKKLIKLLIIFCCFFLLSTFYGQYRAGLGFFNLIIKDIYDLKSFFASSFIYYIANTFDTAITYYMVLDTVPETIDYWYGKSFLSPILVRIPTALFPEKYEFIWASQKFTLLFYGYDQYDPDTVSRGAGFFAEMYLNFGLFGIIVAMGLFGWCNERFSNIANRKNGSNLFNVFYVIYICYFQLYVFKSGFCSAITFIDFKLIYLFLIIWSVRMIKLPVSTKVRLAYKR